MGQRGESLEGNREEQLKPNEMAWEARKRALKKLIKEMNHAIVGKKPKEPKEDEAQQSKDDLVALVLGKK